MAGRADRSRGALATQATTAGAPRGPGRAGHLPAGHAAHVPPHVTVGDPPVLPVPQYPLPAPRPTQVAVDAPVMNATHRTCTVLQVHARGKQHMCHNSILHNVFSSSAFEADPAAGLSIQGVPVVPLRSAVRQRAQVDRHLHMRHESTTTTPHAEPAMRSAAGRRHRAARTSPRMSFVSVPSSHSDTINVRFGSSAAGSFHSKSSSKCGVRVPLRTCVLRCTAPTHAPLLERAR